MRRRCIAILAVVASASVALKAFADAPPATQPAADKSAYTLFNPVPANLLRPFVTDRPNVTQSPYTIDAGHVQAEFSR